MRSSEMERAMDSSNDEAAMADSDEEAQHLMTGSATDLDVDESIPMHEDGRLRIRADINMMGPEYSGRKSSRMAAFESIDEKLPMDTNGKHFGVNDDDDDDDDHLLLGSKPGNEDSDQLEALNREYEELQKQEEEMVNRLKGKVSEDQGKGDAVRHQKVLWDRALETRIAMQKLVTGANQLPVTQGKLALCEGDNECEKAYTMLAESAVAALDVFLELKTALVEQNDAIGETGAANVNAVMRKRKGDSGMEGVPEDGSSHSLSDSLWDRMDILYSSITPFRNSSVDRWQRKTQLATGAAAVKGKLQAFNQSITQQMASALRDPTQLIESICSRKSAKRVIGQPTQASLDNGDRTASTFADTNGNPEEDAVDPELVEDSDFYQQLLLEFLESSDPSGLGGMHLQSARKLRVKKRKTVDRRASKGRKIRYHVHEPLVNFMAPEPMVLPPMASKLFANLFGERTIAPVS